MATKQTNRPRGRPNKGIDKYRQVCIYLPPAMVDELDRLCDLKEQLTGQHTNRTDVIREALRQYLDAMTTGLR